MHTLFWKTKWSHNSWVDYFPSLMIIVFPFPQLRWNSLSTHGQNAWLSYLLTHFSKFLLHIGGHVNFCPTFFGKALIFPTSQRLLELFSVRGCIRAWQVCEELRDGYLSLQLRVKFGQWSMSDTISHTTVMLFIRFLVLKSTVVFASLHAIVFLLI